MEQIEFTNKLWISQKGKKVDKILRCCCWIYLILQIVNIAMGETTIQNVGTAALALLGIIWIRSDMKASGKYVNTKCKITFSKDKIVWEYPEMDPGSSKSMSSIKYDIDTDKIKNISISHDIMSLRLECSPVIEYISFGKKKREDYREKNKSCVLIIYNYDLKVLQRLFGRYTGKEIEFVD